MAKKKDTLKATAKDYEVIIAPVITEKVATVGSDDASGLVLKVNRKANKTEIKNAVENIFEVEVDKVRTCNYLGKIKRTGMHRGYRANYKKAYITLKPGNNLDLYEWI